MYMKPMRMALSASFAYGLFAALWVLISGRTLAALFPDPHAAGTLSICKGWAFIAGTGFLLYATLYILLRRWQRGVLARCPAQQDPCESEERYRVAIENSNDGVALLRGDKHIFVNQRLLDSLGYEADELIGKPLSTTIHPDDREMVARYALKREKGEPVPSTYEFRAVTKKGVTKCVEASVSRVTYRGEPAGLAYLRDITERKKTEEALKESESRFRGAFEASGVGMALVALDGRWLRVNDSLCAMLGYSEAELLTRTFQDLTHPDDLGPDLEYVQRLIDDQIPYYRIEKRYYHRDGYIVWAALSVSLVRDALGYPLHFVGQIEDITEKKLFEEKLQTILITDELTGLYNRRGFIDLASQQLVRASENRDGHALFFADLDRMKWINDTLGHQEGDSALAAVARLLKDTFRESDIIGRIGGDEFAILASAVTEAEQEALLARLQHNVERFNTEDPPNFPISLSIGSSRHEPDDPRPLEALLAEADECMYEKKRGRREGMTPHVRTPAEHVESSAKASSPSSLLK